MSLPRFIPTEDNTFIVSYADTTARACDFANILKRSRACERRGEMEQACNLRYEGVKALIELLPDEDDIVLDWESDDNQAILMLLRASAIDHFLVGDFDMAAGLMEMSIDMDPEDHLETTKPLAFCYVALGEYELFDEVVNDISDKYPEKEILKMWSEFRQSQTIPHGELVHFRRNFPVFYNEFIAPEHPVSEEYLSDIEGEHPSRQSLARELWLQTEHLWSRFPGFIEALQQ